MTKPSIWPDSDQPGYPSVTHSQNCSNTFSDCAISLQIVFYIAGCHLGYCLNMYLQHRNLNTQVAEQRNATLKKLRSMLSYMSLDNFTSHLKIFLWFRSMLSLSSLVPDLPIANIPFFKQLSAVYSKYKSQ